MIFVSNLLAQRVTITSIVVFVMAMLSVTKRSVNVQNDSIVQANVNAIMQSVLEELTPVIVVKLVQLKLVVAKRTWPAVNQLVVANVLQKFGPK